MPGGKVVIYTGILPVTQIETGLAVVMVHELAHAIAQHGNERMSQYYMADLGLMGINVSDDFGGTDAGVVAFSVAMTEVAKGCASTAVSMSVTNLVAEVIQAIGSDEQKATYIPRLCDGTYPAGSFCLSEAGAGSDPSSVQTKAVKDGDEWILDGTKMWISSAEFAGLFVV